MNIHGQTPAFLAVASNVFPAVALHDIFRNSIGLVLLNGEITFRKSNPDLFCKIVVPKILSYVINFFRYFGKISTKPENKNALSEKLRVFPCNFAKEIIEPLY